MGTEGDGTLGSLGHVSVLTSCCVLSHFFRPCFKKKPASGYLSSLCK